MTKYLFIRLLILSPCKYTQNQNLFWNRENDIRLATYLTYNKAGKLTSILQEGKADNISKHHSLSKYLFSLSIYFIILKNAENSSKGRTKGEYI